MYIVYSEATVDTQFIQPYFLILIFHYVSDEVLGGGTRRLTIYLAGPEALPIIHD